MADPGTNKVSNRKLAIVGASFFPATLLSQFLGAGVGLPASADFVLVLAVQALYLVFVIRKSWVDKDRGLISLAIGLVIPIAVFGVIAERALPLTLLADAAIILLFKNLWTLHPPNLNAAQTSFDGTNLITQ